MIPYLRREKILEVISQQELVSIPQLLELFPDVSESTLRRDLKTLAETGQILLLHGGAAKLKMGSTIDVPLADKLTMHQEQKDKIARYAATLIQDGDVLYLDASTTVFPMVNYLTQQNLTIVTSSVTLPATARDEQIKWIILGGEVLISTGSIVGSITENLLSSLFFDKAFIGANGFSLMGGVNTPDYREARKKQIVHQNSKATYLLMDSSKAEVTTFCKVFDLHDCTIITDTYHDLLEQFSHHTVVPPLERSYP